MVAPTPSPSDVICVAQGALYGFWFALGQSWLGCEPIDSWREVEPDVWEDQFGVRWDRSIDEDIGNVCNRLVTLEKLREYQIAASSHSIPADAKPENIAAMVEVLQGR